MESISVLSEAGKLPIFFLKVNVIVIGNVLDILH